MGDTVFASRLTQEGMLAALGPVRQISEASYLQVSIMWVVEFEDDDGGRTKYPAPYAYSLKPSTYELLGPGVPIGLRPNWEEAMKKALRGPDRMAEKMDFEDLMASEGMAGVRKMMARMEADPGGRY